MATLPTKADAVAVEALIDRIGLTDTLNIVAAICAGKAEHILSNWQDPGLAKEWNKIGARVSDAADHVNSLACG